MGKSSKTKEENLGVKVRRSKTKKVEEEKDKIEEHPIAKAVTSFIHGVRDIEVAALTHIQIAFERRKERFENLIGIIENEEKKINSNDDKNNVHITSTMNIMNAVENINRLQNSKVPQVLELSLFLGLFSIYDNFTGELLTAIYLKKPELFNRVEHSISLSEILQFNSFEELKILALQQEIEDFRRKSYVEQFEELERTFQIKLKEFPKWGNFVECGQRRNLLTHAGGVVSKQYLKMCEREKVSFPSILKVGDKLEIGTNYFVESCELLIEVGFKLGQTLWRKVYPEEIEIADSHLIGTVFEDCLKMDSWDRGQVFGEFAINLKKKASDLNHIIFSINYAISLKFDGKHKETKETLSKIDWSALSNEFKLAEAVLSDNYEKATELMNKIGKTGDYIYEESYHQFPLFKEFRQTKQFLETYEKIYGQSFANKVQKDADKQTEEVEKQNIEEMKLKET